ncbi:MAG: hypothetical protein EOT05_03215 [Candidatus Microsaccharimonas sossegonensis]|uniref:CobQ/CobB/MinD/ParA nucleotide binding domain protein n=1 Tax=Candidatus Microsaccharimonas sossegonensis TaxID=2506948 RepID=A0A4Q0AHR9_9BACT|nr:MAG: hypothetical protein EOT05_03215 [Candidatus Microsaccharimonas sossegonensis]
MEQQQQVTFPRMVHIVGRNKDEDNLIPMKAQKPKREPRQSVTSLMARRRSAFEAKLEPWVLAGKPEDTSLRAVWWLYAALKLNKFDWLPQPRMVMSYNAASDKIMQWLNHYRPYFMAIITVMTDKGGATKTTISTWLVATLATATHLASAVFDTNRGGGKVAGRFNLLKEDMISTTRVSKHVNRGNTPTYDELIEATGTDDATGVVVFHHLAGHSISVGTMIKTVTELKHNFHTFVIDTSPNLRDPATFGASKASTVRVLVGKAGSKEDLEDIGEALDNVHYQLREQLETVVISLSDLPVHMCGTREQYAFAAMFKVSPEQIVLIPFDPHLKKIGKVVRKALTPQARYALTTLAQKVATTAMRINGYTPE